MGVVCNMDVLTNVPRSQCLADTGRPLIGTRWVDTTKGGGDRVPKVRSRIAVQ